MLNKASDRKITTAELACSPPLIGSTDELIQDSHVEVKEIREQIRMSNNVKMF